ncbi:MAG: hypothetical protein ACFCUP_06470 [Actinomycetales bacterium]
MTDTTWIAIGAIGGVITALGTAAMAIAIIITAAIARGTLRASRDDSRSRARPIIVAELRRELLSHGAILLVLKNLGLSVASEVSVTFDPGPPDDLSSLPNSYMMKWVYERYATPITTWAPGWTLSNVVRAGEDKLNPMTVHVSYKGPDNFKYRDSYYLHPDHILKETSSTPSKADDPTKLEQQKVAALQALVRAVRSS